MCTYRTLPVKTTSKSVWPITQKLQILSYVIIAMNEQYV